MKKNACGYCGEMIDPSDPYHVHGFNECVCGEMPRHNRQLHARSKAEGRS